MDRIVSKFGGTSVANGVQLRKVKTILDADPRRSVIVVSAPGKRAVAEAKVTDLLYLCHEMASIGADYMDALNNVRERYVAIKSELGLTLDLHAELEAFASELAKGCSADFAASRGEYLNGLLVAEFLGAEFVDPKDYIRITSSGDVDPRTYEALGARLADPTRRYLVPGFYGSDNRGKVKTFSRGGSDITGAVVARAIGASLYENWTDVTGLLMADPRLVKDPLPMKEVTYRELRELAYMGASVLHDEAIIPVREVGIPINIRNTNAPEHAGTYIVSSLSTDVVKTTEIAGVAGKRGFSMICVEKSLMNKEIGFAYQLLGVLQRRGISIEHCPSSIDGINIIVETQKLGDQADEVAAEIRRVLNPDRVTIDDDLALVAVVGEGMSHTIGISAKVFAALRDANINVRVIAQGASEINILVGVRVEDFESAVNTLYSAFVA